MFSEDPFLSGKVAAQYVRGVQEQGVAATLKHFVGQTLHTSNAAEELIQAGNEQEFERMKSDSLISERALREIYLEPFRLAVKEAQPRCFM
jgi:beta-glucosidase